MTQRDKDRDIEIDRQRDTEMESAGREKQAYTQRHM